LEDIEKKGFEAMDLRYFYLTGHYRKKLNFTWKSLESARTARKKLIQLVKAWKRGGRQDTMGGKLYKIDDLRKKFVGSVCDDLNFPKALSYVWELAKGNCANSDKYDLILDWDEILGLRISESVSEEIGTEKQIYGLVSEREEARKEKDFKKADKLRKEIEKKGFMLEDTDEGVRIVRK
jgi:cysteinyl-tRNA synthetase